LSWSGLYSHQIKPHHLKQMLLFARSLARRQSELDRKYLFSDSTLTNPFHPDFLEGAPYRAWTYSYLLSTFLVDKQ
jgi:hypothetical protein